MLHLTETLLLPRTGSTPATTSSLYSLSIFLQIRWERLKQPDDINNYVNYFRYLRDQWLQVIDISHDLITSSLAMALEGQVESRSTLDNIMENVKEMVILCRELLSSDDPLPATRAFSALSNVMEQCYDARREFLDQVIECLREANIRFPYSPDLSFFSWPVPLLPLLRKKVLRIWLQWGNSQLEQSYRSQFRSSLRHRRHYRSAVEKKNVYSSSRLFPK
jgi:hypothetical protein